jgi:hypothetical protein
VVSRQRHAVPASASAKGQPEAILAARVRTHLHVLDETLQKRHEMFRLADVTRNGFLDHIIRQYCSVISSARAKTDLKDPPGFAITSSSSLSRALFASCSPSTSFAYSSCNFVASVRFILCGGKPLRTVEGYVRRTLLSFLTA